MPRQVAARVLLVCAVLLAQQTALAHELWHASGAASQDSKSPAGKKLCDLHDLLGTVLGMAGVVAAQAELVCFSDVDFALAATRAAERRAVAPQSRDPPAVS
jgi:hypothetical protein